MLRGFYTAASGMITQQRYQEALGNNIANMQTPGYKQDQAVIRSFPEMLIQAQGGARTQASESARSTPYVAGTLHTGVYVQEMIPDFSQGAVRETNISTDLAIVQNEVPHETGAVFFTVQNEAGEVRLTRNGSFTEDAEGFLVTSEGYYVLDEEGNPIQAQGLDFTVTTDGVVQSEGQNAALGIVYVEDVHTLVKEGDNLYSGESVQMPQEASYSVLQGSLERSNVNAAAAMTEMMNAYRLFEANQRVLRAYDESLGKTVSEIGRIG